MPNPYRIRSVSAPQRRRNPYIADTEDRRQMQEWGASQIASPAWSPEQAPTAPNVSTNPYAPTWKRLNQPNPYASRPSLSVSGVPTLQSQQPLAPQEQIQLEGKYGPQYGALTAMEKSGQTEALKTLLGQMPPEAQRHPLAQRLLAEQKVGGLPSPMERWRQKQREAATIRQESARLASENKLTQSREVLLPEAALTSAFDYDSPDPTSPVEIRTSQILANHPVAKRVHDKLKLLIEEAHESGAPLEKLMPQIRILDKQFAGIQEKAFQRATTEQAAATEKQQIDNLAQTLSKLPEEEQQRRQSLLSTEILGKLNQAYPGGLPSAKEPDKVKELLAQAGDWEKSATAAIKMKDEPLAQQYWGTAKYLREQARAEMDRQKQTARPATTDPVEELRNSAKGKSEEEQKRIYEQGKKLGYWQ